MSGMEFLRLPQFPQYPVVAGLFRNVENASFLRQQLLQGNTDFEYAFLDAAMLLSRTHALAAVFRAINDMANHRLKTRNVHSEVVFSLSPNNNIAESFRRFGISDDTKTVVAIKIGSTDDFDWQAVEAHLAQHVKGQLVQLTDGAIAEVSDIARIRKLYKSGAPSQKGGAASSEPGSVTALTSFVLGTMALKGS